MPSTSVSSIEDWNRNAFYKSEEEYLFALAEAIGEEYRAIVDAGFLLQVDDPHLVTYYVCHPDKTMEECRKWIALRVEAINHALRGIPKDRVRFHTCYGINFGPRVHDIEVKHIVDILARLNVGAFSFEAANPRHEHEWTSWRDAKLPDDVIMIPGMITQSNVMVEHPELVAQRLGRWIDAFGRERVIAGTDCGFASFAGNDEIHESIVWAKFEGAGRRARRSRQRPPDKRPRPASVPEANQKIIRKIEESSQGNQPMSASSSKTHAFSPPPSAPIRCRTGWWRCHPSRR